MPNKDHLFALDVVHLRSELAKLAAQDGSRSTPLAHPFSRRMDQVRSVQPHPKLFLAGRQLARR